MPGALGEPLDTHGGQHLVSGPELRAGVCTAVLAAQPFAVEQVGAGELRTEPGAAEPVNRFAIEALGDFSLAHERA